MKGATLIVFALFIDGVQAALSASFAIIAAFPGTIAGGVAGCLAGNYFLGDWGCTILGLVGSLFGTLLNELAIVTEPVGIILGFVVSICISCTLGAGLVGLLLYNRMFYIKYAWGPGIEILPGFDILPSWTAMTVACVLQKNKDDKLAAQKIASSLEETLDSDLGPNSYIQRGGKEILSPYRSQNTDGIKPPEVQTNAA